MEPTSHNVELGGFGLAIAVFLFVPVAGAQAGDSWVGQCNGDLRHREISDAQTFSYEVQGDDPTGAAAAFAVETEANGNAYKDCVAPSRIQMVHAVRPVDVKIVNCIDPCDYHVQVVGGPRLTFRCLDDNSTSTAVFPDTPIPSHPCVVQSTFELVNPALGELDQGVLLWRANDCDHPACTPWPQDMLPVG